MQSAKSPQSEEIILNLSYVEALQSEASPQPEEIIRNSSYVKAFAEAKKKYLKSDPRPGYPLGTFTFFRHIGGNSADLKELENGLRDALNNYSLSSEQMIDNHFAKNQASFHYHSFNTYLLDELLEKFPENEKWYPKMYSLEFYKGSLFIALPVANAQKIFREGLKIEAKSEKLDDYVQMKAGMILYKTLDAAWKNSKDDGNLIYQINYRGCDAINILETQRKRGLPVDEKNKEKVCLLEKIKGDDIYGATPSDSKEAVCINSGYDDHRKPDDQPLSTLIVPARDFPGTIFANKIFSTEKQTTQELTLK